MNNIELNCQQQSHLSSRIEGVLIDSGQNYTPICFYCLLERYKQYSQERFCCVNEIIQSIEKTSKHFKLLIEQNKIHFQYNNQRVKAISKSYEENFNALLAGAENKQKEIQDKLSHFYHRPTQTNLRSLFASVSHDFENKDGQILISQENLIKYTKPLLDLNNQITKYLTLFNPTKSGIIANVYFCTKSDSRSSVRQCFHPNLQN